MKALLPTVLALFAGVVLIYYKQEEVIPFQVYSDVRGEEWRLPTTTVMHKYARMLTDMLPRYNYTFGELYHTFDIEFDQYNDSFVLYIWLSIAVGAGLVSIVGFFVLLRMKCGCFGGTIVARGGYTELEVSTARGSTMIGAFVAVTFLVTAGFENTHFHAAASNIMDVYGKHSDELVTKIKTIRSGLPFTLYNCEFYNLSWFMDDLNFVCGQIEQQNDVAQNTVETYETCRYGLVLIILMITMFASCAGVAAGSLVRWQALVVMIVSYLVVVFLASLSVALHMATAKSLDEYCGLSYRHARMETVPPSKVQYLLPCGTSAFYPWLFGHFSVDAVEKANTLAEMLKAIDPTVWSPAWLSTLGDSSVAAAIDDLADSDVTKQYNLAVKAVELFTVMEDLDQCRWTKQKWMENEVVTCHVATNSIQMLWVMQALLGVTVFVVVIGSLGALNTYVWASSAHLRGVIDHQMSKVWQNGPRPKRFPL